MGRIAGGISVSFWFVTAIAVLAYWGNATIVPFIVAIVIHEVAHLLAIFACGYGIKSVNCTYSGIKISIQCENSTLFKEILISLSGSIIGLLFASFFAACGMRDYFYTNFILSVFNLLPITGLDGGKVIFEIFTTASPVHGQNYAEFVSWSTTTLVLLLGAVLYMLNLPSGSFIFAVGVILFAALLMKKN